MQNADEFLYMISSSNNIEYIVLRDFNGIDSEDKTRNLSSQCMEEFKLSLSNACNATNGRIDFDNEVFKDSEKNAAV